MPSRFVRVLWFFSLLLSASLWVYFFTYPFARFIFLPLSVVIALTTWFYPHVGLALFIVTTLTTLQVPIILKFPYFSGPEPGFLALWVTVSLKEVLRPSTFDVRLATPIKIALTIYVLVILVSAFTVWHTLWDLPHPWLRILTFDALSKIYFWRWRNPFHFLRIALLYLEGVAAFFITLHALADVRFEQAREADSSIQHSRLDVRYFRTHAVVTVVYSFIIAGVLLMGYSVMDILYRHKPVTAYGGVFTDRNAYAAFWVLFCPICLALALSLRGPRRAMMLLLFVLGALLETASLSLSGLFAMFVSTAVALLLVGRSVLLTPFRLSFYRRHWRAILACLVILYFFFPTIALLFPSTDPIGMAEKLHNRLVEPWNKGTTKTLMDNRRVPWILAMAMFKDHPLMGIGVGEFYKNFLTYRAQFRDLWGFDYQGENAHNYLLQLAAETGMLGGGSFLALSLYLLGVGCKSIRLYHESPRLHSPIAEQVLAGAEAHASEANRPSQSVRSLPRSEPQRDKYYLGGLIAAVCGLAAFSLAQHPMLRLEFQIYFWIFGTCIFALSAKLNRQYSVHPKPEAFDLRLVICAVALVFISAAVQAFLFPMQTTREFEYGLREWETIDGVRFRSTEANAYLRTPSPSQKASVELRNPSGPSGQGVKLELYLNGRRSSAFLKGGGREEVRYTVQGGELLELGVQSRPVLPAGFSDSWGKGILLGEIKATRE